MHVPPKDRILKKLYILKTKSQKKHIKISIFLKNITSPPTIVFGAAPEIDKYVIDVSKS